VVDEVGSGFSRCGKLFGIEIENVTPDIITFAKGISNGAAPIGACVVKKEFADAAIWKAKLVSTFGWTPLACAAALTTLKIHKRDKIWQQAGKKGSVILQKLKKQLSLHPKVGAIHGIGMEIGVTFIKDKKSKQPDTEVIKKIVSEAHKKGLHIVDGGDGNIQLMPPLTTPQNVLNEGVDILVETVNQLS
jgi:4-aminobutyrate aminotransferase-like enzyme